MARTATRREASRPAAAARPFGVVLAGLVVLLLVSVVLGIGAGSVPIAPTDALRALAGRLVGREPHGDLVMVDAIVTSIRLPRVVLAAVVGAALGTAGVVVQVLVRNVLADPYLLGVSSGASVGATAVLLFGAFASLGIWALSVGGVVGAGVAMGLVFAVSQRGGRLVPLQLLLCGVALAAMFSALASFLLFRGDPRASQTVLYWLLGSFGSANWTQLPIPAAVLLVSLALLLGRARSLNALALGPDVAASVGVDVHATRRLLFVVVCLVAGVCVAVSGVIGFIGLVVPHVVRLLVGSDHRRILPAALLVGATFAVLGDLLARVLVAPQEMPMGVVTAFLGAPLLIWLIRRRPELYAGAR